MKEGSLFCFVIVRSPNHGVLSFVMELIMKKLSMNKGALFGVECLELLCGIY
jgi:hypothetical protein